MVGRYVVSESVHVKENYTDTHLNTLRKKKLNTKNAKNDKGGIKKCKCCNVYIGNISYHKILD